jgi:ATP-dependent RNA helicase HelY
MPYEPKRPGFQRQVAEGLARAELAGPDGGEPRPRRVHGAERDGAIAAHRVSGCPELRAHLRAVERADRLERDVRRLERRIKSRNESLARQLDRVLGVLEAWGYVLEWSLTEAGHRLVRIYHECDLLVAEAVRTGLFAGLDVPEVAALVSVLTYEARGRAPGPQPTFPSRALRARWAALERLAGELNAAEEGAGLPLTRPPDAGFVQFAHAWAAGESLAEVVAEEEISGGDFVRNVKQLADVLRQIGEVAEPETAHRARAAADRLFRGIVAASSVVEA